jgi:pimeloyl-ACP methyl ester carboxylesterase
MTRVESVVLVPGLACDEAVWRHQAAELGRQFEVHIASHDGSDSLGAAAKSVLTAAPERFALVGHSMGGRVALEVLALAPARVVRLALLDTGFDALPSGEPGEREKAKRARFVQVAREEGMLAMGKEWAVGMVHPQRLADSALMNDIHQMIARCPPARFEAQIRALLARPDRGEFLRDIAAPTLILCGREDRWSPLNQHIEMARRIRGSVLVDVPDCGHMSTMERPEAVTAALLQWLHAE